MRNLARHRISSQSSRLREDARTGQSMPHRRSSDVAAAVWLIHGGDSIPELPLAINNGFDKPSALSRLGSCCTLGWECLAQLAGNASQYGNIKVSSKRPDR